MGRGAPGRPCLCERGATPSEPQCGPEPAEGLGPGDQVPSGTWSLTPKQVQVSGLASSFANWIFPGRCRRPGQFRGEPGSGDQRNTGVEKAGSELQGEGAPHWKRVLRIAPYRRVWHPNRAPRRQGAGRVDLAAVSEAALCLSLAGGPGHTGALGLAWPGTLRGTEEGGIGGKTGQGGK